MTTLRNCKSALYPRIIYCFVYEIFPDNSARVVFQLSHIPSKFVIFLLHFLCKSTAPPVRAAPKRGCRKQKIVEPTKRPTPKPTSIPVAKPAAIRLIGWSRARKSNLPCMAKRQRAATEARVIDGGLCCEQTLRDLPENVQGLRHRPPCPAARQSTLFSLAIGDGRLADKPELCLSCLDPKDGAPESRPLPHSVPAPHLKSKVTQCQRLTPNARKCAS